MRLLGGAASTCSVEECGYGTAVYGGGVSDDSYLLANQDRFQV